MTISAMRRFLLLLTVTMGLGLMAPAPVFAKDEEESADPNTIAAVADKGFANELKALAEAESMLKTVTDAKSAKEVKKKLMRKFSYLRPLLNGTDPQLEALAAAQNKVSAIMWEMMKEPYFESEGMQELWTVITHHFARRSAQ